MAEIKLTIQHDSTIYEPAVVGDITVEWVRFGTPGKMIFSVIKDGNLKYSEGDVARLVVDGKNFFFGFIFTEERQEKNIYSLTCYDVIRYLRSDDIFKMPKQTYTKAIKKVAKRYGIKTGTIANTKYVRKAKVFNGCILDMLDNYRKTTKQSTGKTYILYADFNKLCLKAQSSMKTNYIMEASVMEGFTYASSIDDKVYTVVKLYKGSGKKMKVYSKTVSKAKKKYGRLTYVAETKLKSKSKIKKKLKSIAEAHDAPRKKLSLQNVWGLTDIRAGSGITVKLEEDNFKINKKMTVNSVTHRFSEGRHTMDLNVFGGDFKNE